jgi:hypothetical protein
MRRLSLLALALTLTVMLPVMSAGAAHGIVWNTPGDLSIEARSAAGAAVTYTVSATNPGGKTLDVVCEPASGSLFPLGDTTVTCSVTDKTESERTSFRVTVEDTTPPTLAAPGEQVVEANGPGGSVVSYPIPSASDAVDGPVPVTCAPPSGSTFPLGSTTVTCSALDSRRNTAQGTFAVVVRDTVAPALNVPAPIEVTATSASGVEASVPVVAAFLRAATSSDVVTARPTIVHDAPSQLPLSTTVVSWTATDAAGNRASANSSITVLPAATPSPSPPAPTPALPAPPSPPPAVQHAPAAAPDTTAPANVSAVSVKTGNRTVMLSWRPPPDGDFAQVRVQRSLRVGAAQEAPVTVYEGRAASLRDGGLRNGVEYRYVITSYDRAGNAAAGVAVVAVPKAVLLRAPADGAVVARPPVLSWTSIAGARYYNVQLYWGKQKILSAWPSNSRLALRPSWKYAGRAQRLRPGRYRWYVWPGLGARQEARYGEVLGQRTFTVVPS